MSPNGADMVTASVRVPKWMLWLVMIIVPSFISGAGSLAYSTRQDLHATEQRISCAETWQEDHEDYTDRFRQDVLDRLTRLEDKIDRCLIPAALPR